MFISPDTVKTHLAHIYDKLGVRTRTDNMGRTPREAHRARVVPPGTTCEAARSSRRGPGARARGACRLQTVFDLRVLPVNTDDGYEPGMERTIDVISADPVL